MATHQDHWPNVKRAREWLMSLQIGDQLLHPKVKIDYNRTDPSGKDFEIVSIKSINPDHVIISYPNLSHAWDRKLLFKYAFAVRPVGSIKIQSEEDTLSQSSSTSDASMVAPQHIVPFPNSNLANTNIQNGRDKVTLTFHKKHKTIHKQSLLASSSSSSPEVTPDVADKTCFNRLHEARHNSRSTSPTLKKTYADSRGSKNRRNRAIAASSVKKMGHLKKDQQQIDYQKTLLHNSDAQKHKQEEEEDEKEDTSIDDERGTMCRNGRRSYGQHTNRTIATNRYYDSDDENKGPITRGKYRQQQNKQYVSPRNTPNWLTKSASLKEPIGLQNMGNTCFMNSTLQSLIHTEELRHFFLNNEENKWLTEQLNTNNPIGYGGKIAVNFSKLVYKQCEESDSSSSRYYRAIKPNMIHYNLSGTLRQFADFRQHDAQEFLTNFLDGLHEDLNRIKTKKYLEIPDFDAKDEQHLDKRRAFLHKRWHEIYLKRNHSVCTDLFAGLLKSTVTCPACDFTAITFDPFMHLLLPLKAPKSMLRERGSYHNNSNNSSNYGNKRGRFEVTDEETEGEEEQQVSMDEKYKEICIHFLPKQNEASPVRFVIKINDEIENNNDWLTLHCMIYDHLIKRYAKPDAEDELSQEEERHIMLHRLQMIKSADYTLDQHFVYYGMQDIDKVKQQYADDEIIPKSIDETYITPFPIFRLYELYQDHSVLSLESIRKQSFNTKISDYVLQGGHRRLCVQQLPPHWTDPMRMNEGEDRVLNCYLVFEKPSYDKKEEEEEDDDLLCDNKAHKQQDEEEQIPYEPFSYPRMIFSGGLIAKLDEEQQGKYLQRTAQNVAVSIAGDAILQHIDDMQIRYCRNEEERYSLDKIAKWNQVNTNNNNSNSQAPKAIHTIVIVFSFAMHAIYSKHQFNLELKEEKRGKKTLKKGRKRSYQAMNGGDSRYSNDDSVNCVSRKRQKVNGSFSHNGYRNREYHIMDKNEDVRDVSLPLSFQPKERMAQTINECFGIFLSREQLGKDNQWFCKKCKDHVRGRKKLDLWWLPSHLIIAIKRFDNHGLRKYPNHVDYPVNGLDLSDIIRGKDTLDIYHNEHDIEQIVKCNAKHKNEKFVYDLYAVINHSGSLNFGHYTATIKFDKKWYNISDSNVSQTQNPISSQAYILCYKKKQAQ